MLISACSPKGGESVLFGHLVYSQPTGVSAMVSSLDPRLVDKRLGNWKSRLIFGVNSGFLHERCCVVVHWEDTGFRNRDRSWDTTGFVFLWHHYLGSYRDEASDTYYNFAP